MSSKFVRGSSLVLASVVATAVFAQTSPQPANPSGSTSPRTERPDGHTMPSDHGTTAARKPLSAQSFASQATVISKAEIELGQLALKNSKDQDVQKFAQRMITDHTNADKQLKTVAAKQSLDLPRQLDPEHQALKDKLSKLSGAEFDREYTKAMVEGHEKAVALFEAASKDTQLPGDLKQFAASTLPTLKDHRDMAHSVEGQADAEKSGDRSRS
jgi:putative membrane protein